MSNARLIAFEGIDGSGKGTQSKRLCDTLEAEGKRVSMLSFPRYSETNFGRAIGDFLNGRFGELDQVSPWLTAALYAGDRFESLELLRSKMEANDVVVLDRYVGSNIAHQGSKVESAERDELIQWIQQIEFGVYRLPRPEIVVLLDLPVEASATLIAKKAARDYTDQKEDLQEANKPYLAAVRDCYRGLANGDEWRTIDCLKDDKLRSVEEIGDEIRNLVTRELGI